MRLFVAVWPPPEVVQELAALPRLDVPGLRWTPADHWHVTLRFLGSVEEQAARDAFGRIEAGAPEVRLGPETGRFGRRVLHVPVHGLEGVAAAVGAATARLGQSGDERPFHGHLTLARARDRRGVDLRPLAGVPVSGSWLVEEVFLVASHLGGGRPARYEVVERLCLGSG